MTKYYKGFNKDMTCNGFQYEEGEEYEFEGEPMLCRQGFHVCEAPLDVLRYYPNRNGNVFREVECEGITDERLEDSKRVCKKILIGSEIGIKGLIEAHRIYTRKKAESGEKGGNDSNIAGGDCSNIAGGNGSLIIARNSSRAKAGLYSIIVLSRWDSVDGVIRPVEVKSEIVDGEHIKPDTWYKLEKGEFVEVSE